MGVGFVCGIIVNLWFVFGIMFYPPASQALPVPAANCDNDANVTNIDAVTDMTLITQNVDVSEKFGNFSTEGYQACK